MVIFGSTNTDGTGSAANLSQFNGQMIDWQFDSIAYYMHENFKFETEHVSAFIQNISDMGAFGVDVTNHGPWNGEGVKELFIRDTGLYNISETTEMNVGGFVDVNIALSNVDAWWGTFTLNINGAKRGDVDLSSFEQNIHLNIDAYSNSGSWGNLYTIATGNGDDTVTFSASSEQSNTHWTEFSVDLGAGDDRFVLALHSADSADMTRFIDGGDGFDEIALFADSIALDFANVEWINAKDSTVELRLTEQQLATNGDDTFGLIVSNAQIEFTDSIIDIDVTALSDAQYAYLDGLDSDLSAEDYFAVTAYGSDASYQLLMNNVDNYAVA